MSSKPMQCHVWYPTERGGETLRQREEDITRTWLRENISSAAQREWLRITSYFHPSMRCEDAIRTICKHDSCSARHGNMPCLQRYSATRTKGSLPKRF